MAWPQPTDYYEAIQIPQRCFRDAELAAGEVAADPLGMPRPWSGNFADVYQIRGASGQSWAVKCFTREVDSLQQRYQAISDHLRQGSPPFMVQFQYLRDGIRIKNQWYPILKMDWVEGFTLNDFVRRHAEKPQVMYRLAQIWVKLSLQLRKASMAHADLQHGNVLLVPGERAAQLSLRLIDYDGMFIPSLAGSPSGELGHPNYQHPERLRHALYSAEVDRFSHLLIYTALRALTVGGRPLWEKYDNGENLLFREVDFARPQESQLLLDLWQLPDTDLRHLLGHLLIGSQNALDRVALLDEVVGSEGRALALTVAQEHQTLELLPPGAARMKSLPAELPRFTLQELVARQDEPLDGKLAESELPRWYHAPNPTLWVVLDVAALVIFAGAAALLPGNEPGLKGVVAVLLSTVAVVLVPLASASIINASLGQNLLHPDLRKAYHWWTASEICPNCGCTNVIPLYICRLCGRMNWVRLGGICAFAMVAAVLVLICQPGLQAPDWWVVLTMFPRWLGRFAALAAAFVILIGTFNAWKLQTRLPSERRLRSQGELAALSVATVMPVIVMVLLLISLYRH